MKNINKKPSIIGWFYGDPTGNRTRDSAVRGRRLDRLTIGPFQFIYSIRCFFNMQENILRYLLRFMRIFNSIIYSEITS